MSKKSLSVLYEDNHLLVVNKPNGILSQGDNTGDKTILDMGKEYIKVKYNKPGKVFLHPVSRIDRPVSGAIILARTSKSLSRMTKTVKNRLIEKRYSAIVSGRPKLEEDRLEDHLLKTQANNTVKVVKQGTPKAKKAILDYKVSYIIKEGAVLDVLLYTGRPHQIRVQLANMGHPIIGDGKYGYRSPKDLDYIYLHCRSLRFEHPVKKEPILITAAYPKFPLWQQLK